MTTTLFSAGTLKRAILAAALISAALTTGCMGNITGLSGAAEDFGCPASGGVNCTTVSATYEREHAKERESLKKTLTSPASGTKGEPADPVAVREAAEASITDVEGLRVTVEPAYKSQSSDLPPVAVSGMDWRSPERVVMLWILPWEDGEGDLHSASRLWMRVRDARWRIESVRSRAMTAAPETRP